MQSQIRRVGAGLVLAFIAVFLQLNYVQIFAAERIAGNSANVRALLREYSIKRGDILTSDGEEIATSKKTGGRLQFQRQYPGGNLYAHLSGFYSITYGKSRLEATYDEQLLGDAGVLSMQDIEDRLFGSGEQGEDIVLTVNSELQKVAQQALGGERGAVVAIEPQTGAVKAMWSNPSYDPGPLASHTSKEAKAHWESLDPKSQSSPLISLATSRTYPPGSTFKVVTTAAALESGRYDQNDTFPDPEALLPCSESPDGPCMPDTDQDLTNFTKTSCTGNGQIDLFTALEISCDTTYAILGLEIPEEIFETAEEFGFNETLPFDVGAEVSNFPKEGDDRKPFRAYAAIGQGDAAATPLQMAMVAAGVANGGDVMKPYLVQQILDPGGASVRETDPETFGTPMSSATARIVKDMMVAVVETGTGVAAQIPGVRVAGKTGTAQTVEGANPHTWFISFAPADDPQIAIAVIVENGGSFGSEATGGAVAAPIAKAVMEADRRISGW